MSLRVIDNRIKNLFGNDFFGEPKTKKAAKKNKKPKKKKGDRISFKFLFSDINPEPMEEHLQFISFFNEVRSNNVPKAKNSVFTINKIKPGMVKLCSYCSGARFVPIRNETSNKIIGCKFCEHCIHGVEFVLDK